MEEFFKGFVTGLRDVFAYISSPTPETAATTNNLAALSSMRLDYVKRSEDPFGWNAPHTPD